ncbi:MAG: dTDP-4-dehydrorhamnose reductase, partial [Verrucomicrobiota bacterium]
VALDRASLPLGVEGKVESVLGDLQFDVLVNCAALTNVDYCESHPEEAFKINGEAANDIALHCEDRGARCIHISTDYVFDGNSGRPYTESDEPSPISVYGASKRMGEEAVLSAGSRHWVVRVSWVFGPDRVSFVDQVISRAVTEQKVDAVDDKWASPTYTLDAATLLYPFLRRVQGGGVLHLSNTDVCTWQEYGQWALDCARQEGVHLKTTTVGGVPMSSIKAFIAKRPVYTAMDTQKLARLARIEPRSWKDAVQAHVQNQVQRGLWARS